MGEGVNAVLALGGLAVQVVCASAALADEGAEEGSSRAAEERWVPSLAITSGVLFQGEDGFAESETVAAGSSSPVALQPRCDMVTDPSCSPVPVTGNDTVTAPFVGAALEIMSPALPIPTRPRLFVSGEIIPTFASDRALALDGDPTCVRGPEPDAPCAVDEDGSRQRPFGEMDAVGQGIRTTTEIDTLVYGAGLGLAFPLQFWEHQLRIKPSFGWISYEVKARGVVVNAACSPETRCTTTTPIPGFPPVPGFLREPESLSAADARRFDGVGPGLDVEMDTGRFGPIGSALFLGMRAYRILGDRKISFGTSQAYNDPVGIDVDNARFQAEVNPWMFRTHVGIRFLWLGSEP